MSNGTSFLTSIFESKLGSYLTKKNTFVHNVSELLNVIQVELPQHLNFEQEVSNQMRMSKLFEFNSTIVIPKIYSWTKNEIIMEHIHGTNLFNSENTETAITNLLNGVFDMLFVYRTYHGDLHEGNILVCSESRIALLDFGIIYEISIQNVQHLFKFFLFVIQNDYSSLCQCILSKQTILNFDQLY